MSSRYKRHTLVWLSPAGWEQAGASLTPALRAQLQRWQQHDWPAVVRRRDADATDEQVCLGIALPPDTSGHKLRVPLRVASQHIRRQRPPLLIAEVLLQAPQAWRTALARLQQQAQALDLRVYGSLALQALTGEAYLRPGSDIDLLFQPDNAQQLVDGMQLLATYASALPLDGEVVFPQGAVAWKEWQQVCDHPDGRVLLKGNNNVALLLVAEVVAALTTLARPSSCELPTC